MKSVKAKCKIWKKKTDKLKTHLTQFQLFIYFKLACLQKNFARTTIIHPGIFLGRALWAHSRVEKAPWLSVSPQMNTITSRDQFRPILIRENSVVNYKR